MINFLKRLFTENKYDEYIDDICLHWKKWEFFILEEFTKDQLVNFFKCEKTNSLIKEFKRISELNKSIKKNTSLLILLKVEKLEDFEELKNQIMKIEEDEYFFRKYIIIYDDIWEKELKKLNDINELNNELLVIDLDKFRKSSFENSKWYLIIQLFVKLPFLKLEINRMELENLSDKIYESIGISKLNTLDDQIISKSYLKKDENEDDYFRDLEKDILDESNKEIGLSLDKLLTL
jgi:hypothetical protein